MLTTLKVRRSCVVWRHTQIHVYKRQIHTCVHAHTHNTYWMIPTPHSLSELRFTCHTGSYLYRRHILTATLPLFTPLYNHLLFTLQTWIFYLEPSNFETESILALLTINSCPSLSNISNTCNHLFSSLNLDSFENSSISNNSSVLFFLKTRNHGRVWRPRCSWQWWYCATCGRIPFDSFRYGTHTNQCSPHIVNLAWEEKGAFDGVCHMLD